MGAPLCQRRSFAVDVLKPCFGNRTVSVPEGSGGEGAHVLGVLDEGHDDMVWLGEIVGFR